MKELVEYITKSLVEYPDQVVVTEVRDRSTTVLEVTVAESDKGRVIGREGRVVNAVRTLVQVRASKTGRRVSVEIV